MSRKLLIVGDSSDPHTQIIQNKYQALGGEVFIYSPFYHDPNQCDLVTVSLNSNYCSMDIKFGAQSLPLTELDSVWWRNKPTTIDQITGVKKTSQVAFMKREIDRVVESISAFTRKECLWINTRSKELFIRNKPVQLQSAIEAGFRIPNTVISNDVSRVTSFLEDSSQEYIYKPLSWYYNPPDEILYTASVDLKDVLKSPDSIALAPGIFQERIHKDYEYRITVVGQDIYPVKIESQHLASTELDWRKDQLNVSYSVEDLSLKETAKLLKLHQNIGLEYGAYDFARTSSGDLVFFEVNPQGQYLWLEEEANLGIDISGSLAGHLFCH